MTGKVVPYVRWVERYGRLVRPEMGPEPWDAAGDVDLPAEPSYRDDYLIASLGGATAWERPPDGVENLLWAGHFMMRFSPTSTLARFLLLRRDDRALFGLYYVGLRWWSCAGAA